MTFSSYNMETVTKRRVVVGDIHGELTGLTAILRHAKLIGPSGKWTGGETVLIQTGDVVDRGPCTWECVRLLRELQRQAPEFGGEVVRLCGNHELWLMRGPDFFYFAEQTRPPVAEPEKLGEELKAEVAIGILKAAHTDGCRLYTHAGLRSKVKAKLLEEMGAPNNIRKNRVDLIALVKHINDKFQELVARGEFERHPMFWIDKTRNGGDPIGGIFWCDYRSISPSERAFEIPQIFGHTPSFKNELQHSHSLKLINVDAGMTEDYGGYRVYLEITSEGEIVQHALKKRTSTRWSSVVLGREAETVKK